MACPWLPARPAGRSLALGDNDIGIVVTGEDGINTMTYSLTSPVCRTSLPLTPPLIVPVTVRDFAATGNTAISP